MSYLSVPLSPIESETYCGNVQHISRRLEDDFSVKSILDVSHASVSSNGSWLPPMSTTLNGTAKDGELYTHGSSTKHTKAVNLSLGSKNSGVSDHSLRLAHNNWDNDLDITLIDETILYDTPHVNRVSGIRSKLAHNNQDDLDITLINETILNDTPYVNRLSGIRSELAHNNQDDLDITLIDETIHSDTRHIINSEVYHGQTRTQPHKVRNQQGTDSSVIQVVPPGESVYPGSRQVSVSVKSNKDEVSIVSLQMCNQVDHSEFNSLSQGPSEKLCYNAIVYTDPSQTTNMDHSVHSVLSNLSFMSSKSQINENYSKYQSNEMNHIKSGPRGSPVKTSSCNENTMHSLKDGNLSSCGFSAIEKAVDLTLCSQDSEVSHQSPRLTHNNQESDLDISLIDETANVLNGPHDINSVAHDGQARTQPHKEGNQHGADSPEMSPGRHLYLGKAELDVSIEFGKSFTEEEVSIQSGLPRSSQQVEYSDINHAPRSLSQGAGEMCHITQAYTYPSQRTYIDDSVHAVPSKPSFMTSQNQKNGNYSKYQSIEMNQIKSDESGHSGNVVTTLSNQNTTHSTIDDHIHDQSSEDASLMGKSVLPEQTEVVVTPHIGRCASTFKDEQQVYKKYQQAFKDMNCRQFARAEYSQQSPIPTSVWQSTPQRTGNSSQDAWSKNARPRDAKPRRSKLEPLTTDRLQPIRQKTQNAVVSLACSVSCIDLFVILY